MGFITPLDRALVSRPRIQGAPHLINFKHDNTAKLREAILNAKNGVSSDVIAFGIDSKEWGAWSDGVDSDGLEQQSPSSYLKQYLTSHNICPADNDSFFGCGILTTNARIKKYDSRFTGSTTAVPNTGVVAQGLGGYPVTTSTNAAAAGFNTSQAGAPAVYNRIDFHFANPPSPRNMDIGITGVGVLQNIGNDAGKVDAAARKVTVTAPDGSINAATVTNKQAAAINWNGIRLWNTLSPKLSLVNLGIPGALVADWDTDATAVPSSFTAGLECLAPKALCIKGFTNDCRLQTAQATLKGGARSLFDKQLARGGGLLLIQDTQRGTDPLDPTPTPLSLWQEYRGYMEDLRAEYDLPMVDLVLALGDWDRLNALGYMHDVSHHFAIGNQAVAGVIGAGFALAAAL